MRSSALAVLSLIGLVAANSHPRDFHPPGLDGLFGDWRPAGEGDSRSPCPVLNTLANEGILPHDGLNISVATLNETLQDVLNLSPEVTAQIVALVAAIAPANGTLNLGDLALHNVIEHDASLVHDDTPAGSKYAPVGTDYLKVANVAAVSSDGRALSERDFAAARLNAEKRSPKLDDGHQQLADGEPALALSVFGVPDGASGALKLPLLDFLFLFGLNRLPPGFTKKTTPISGEAVGSATARIVAYKAAIQKSEAR